jgi:quercetin dioxygenase-like cupin family protein
MFDRTTEVAKLNPVVRHPIVRGVEPFVYRDEFYPTIRFNEDGEGITAILAGNLHVQYRDGEHLPIGEPTPATVAWAFERPDGGRSFGYTGLHYLAALDEAPLRRMIANAILWTAGREVPERGVSFRSRNAAVMAQQTALRGERDPRGEPLTDAVVATVDDYKVDQFPWGYLTWYVSGALGNSDTMTIGQAVINPGQENPPHYHPNCDEVLHVLKGRILQTVGDKAVEMNEGDTVSIPTGIRHQARNIGDEDAVLAISFSSADRQTVGE